MVIVILITHARTFLSTSGPITKLFIVHHITLTTSSTNVDVLLLMGDVLLLMGDTNVNSRAVFITQFMLSAPGIIWGIHIEPIADILSQF